MLLIIFIVFGFCFLIERIKPGWNLPNVPTWTIRVLGVNFVQLSIVVLAGTPGKNGVGHTAITLTKTGSNGESITQTLEFYPSGNKFEGPSKIVNNGNDMDFTIQMNFDLGANNEKFSSILNYISNPPKTYELMEINCTYFINEACKKGGIALPSAWSNIAGFMAPLNVARVMTPAGLAQSLRNLKNNGDNRIKTNPGKAPLGKGSCK